MDNTRQTKAVFTITERNGKSYWTRIGWGFLNSDGSLTLKLDAIPVNGQMQVRDHEPFDSRRRQQQPQPQSLEVAA